MSYVNFSSSLDQILGDVEEVYQSFVDKPSTFNLTDDKCARIRDYFQKGREQAQRLDDHIFYAGVAASVTWVAFIAANSVPKIYINMHRLSTLTMAAAVGTTFWLFYCFFQRSTLSKKVGEELPFRDGADEKAKQETLNKLRETAKTMQDGCVPGHSYAIVNNESMPILSACIKKNSLKAAIFAAMAYESKERLAEDAKYSFAYIKNEQAAHFLDRLGAGITSDDIEILNNAAQRVNIVAMRELFKRGVPKNGNSSDKKAPIEYAVDNVKRATDMQNVLTVFGAADHDHYTTPKDLAEYLNDEGIRISERYAKKIIDSRTTKV